MRTPALIAFPGGRADFFGAPMSRTWVKLGMNADVGETKLFLAEAAAGWKAGDRILVTATSRQYLYTGTYTKTVSESPRTEERIIQSIDRQHDMMRLTLDRPLQFAHRGEGKYRGEVANLSRNVFVESADPAGVRGHTMYHAESSASIAYAEFRGLGKKGVLGRYPLHFHHAGESMRGSSIVGASIHDSENHLLTLHDTRYFVVRDCVGYRSLGHGFFLEDGTEAFNVFDRNLVIQALRAPPNPKQFLPFDNNDGAGFWWANNRNAFTRNVAVECDQYGFRFEVVKSEQFDPVLNVAMADGSMQKTDLRTIPLLRFDQNEAHSQRRFGLNLGGIASHRGYDANDPNYKIQTQDVGGVGPDRLHPFLLTDSLLWDCQWPFHAGSPMVMVDGMDIFDCEYGLWRTVTTNHTYRNLTFDRIRSHTIFFPRTGGAAQLDPSQESPPSPKDDQPPITIVTSVTCAGGKTHVEGTTADNGDVKSVTASGIRARARDANFVTWEIELDDAKQISACAEDVAGNIEPRPHLIRLTP